MIIDTTQTKMEREIEDELFAQAFGSLFRSMPSLDYATVGRKLLYGSMIPILVDKLPQGALARFERPVAAIAILKEPPDEVRG